MNMETLKDILENSLINSGDMIPVKVAGDYYFEDIDSLLAGDYVDCPVTRLSKDKVENHWEESIDMNDYQWYNIDDRLVIGIW